MTGRLQWRKQEKRKKRNNIKTQVSGCHKFRIQTFYFPSTEVLHSLFPIHSLSPSMVYKAINGQAPTHLSSLFNSISAVKNRMLRNSILNLRPPRLKTKYGQNSFAYKGTKIWNSLPNNCRKANTFPPFNEKLQAMIA